jgi:hypothetical protein
MPANPFGVRRDLRAMTVPAAIAYVVITVLTLLAKTVSYAFALVAEVAERLADAGESARDAAHHTPVDLTPSAPFTTTGFGRTHATRSAR